jgi:hypothetical protein
MSYSHGVYASQLPTSIVPPRRVYCSLPVIIGTAPVHMISESMTGAVNEPVLAHSYDEAVKALGYSEDWGKYTLSEAIYTYFALYGVGPIVLINVFDPATHKSEVTDEAATFAGGIITLANPGLVSDPVIKSSDGVTTYVANTDYTFDKITGVISLVEGGSITAGAEVKVTYSYGDPSKVTSNQIIGGVNAETGAKSGLELANEVFPRFGLVPALILAPGWSHDPIVAAVMATKADSLNGGHFDAMAVADIPCDASGCTKYSDVAAWKATNNYTDNNLVACWPMLKLGDKKFHLSTQAAALMGKVDEANDDIPYESPSNKPLEMNGAVLADGSEVWLGPESASYLNGQGVTTALNWNGRWTLWGNRTAAYPTITDVKDSFIPVQRMFRWKANEFVLTFWQKVDQPITKRIVESIVDSENIRLNGLAAREAILGGRIEFLAEENPVTDLMDGVMAFHLYLTPPSPAREISARLEYDPGYFSTLFAR